MTASSASPAARIVRFRWSTARSRKRHIGVDVLGCLRSVVVHAANIHDTKGGISAARRAYEHYPSIQKFCADAGYRFTFVSDLKEQLTSAFQRKSSPPMGKTALALGG